MINLNRFSLIGILLLIVFSLNAQDSCQVLIPELSGTYMGKCKKGFAHGEGKAVGTDTYEGNFRKGLPNGNGVYTWASGANYSGSWVYGQRDGEGIYKFKYDGKDSVQEGIWKDDLFMGKRARKPVVNYKEFVTKYSFRRKGDGNQILIDLRINGQPNLDIIDFSMIYSNGSSFEMGRSYGIEQINFPVNVKVKYISWNAAHSSQHNATFDFEIFEAGNWQVIINN